MQLAATRPGSIDQSLVLASQTIDVVAHPVPAGGTVMRATDREFRLAGATNGIDVFTSADDAIAAARALSAGSAPGLAVVEWRTGFRLHDVHTTSRSYWMSSPHGPLPPITRLTDKSSVPFAAGNIRPEDTQQHRHEAAVQRSAAFVALVDGDRMFAPSADQQFAGRAKLVETKLA